MSAARANGQTVTCEQPQPAEWFRTANSVTRVPAFQFDAPDPDPPYDGRYAKDLSENNPEARRRATSGETPVPPSAWR